MPGKQLTTHQQQGLQLAPASGISRLHRGTSPLTSIVFSRILPLP